MASLNSIAEDIAFQLGDQFNNTLKESIKNKVIEYRALFIRQDLERNALSYSDYLDSFCVELEEVDASQCPEAITGNFVLKSKQKIPKPIRQKTNGRVNYKFVGSIDRRKTLTFATMQELEFLTHLAFQDSVIYYAIYDNYLYVLNNLKFCKLLIEGVIADPRDIDDCEFPDVFPDDLELTLPLDMVSAIKKSIERDYRIITDGEEVNIAKDDKA